MTLQIKKLFFVLFFAFFCSSVSAKDNDLKRMIRTVYPAELRTVSDLVQFILEGTEYKLYRGLNAPHDAREILRQKIPYQRKQVLMTRANALLMAVGEKNSIVVDHDNKLISVTRSPIND